MQETIANHLSIGVHVFLNELFHVCLRHSRLYKVLGTEQRPLLPRLMDDADSSEENILFTELIFSGSD